VPRVSTASLVCLLVLVALLWFLSVQFYTGCSDGGCSDTREVIASLRFPLAAIWLVLLIMAGIRLWSRLWPR
jgi:hypothetical protein